MKISNLANIKTKNPILQCIHKSNERTVIFKNSICSHTHNKMLSSQILTGVKNQIRGVVCTRNIGILAPALQKASDPIQQLFVDKLREYKQKSAGGTKLVEPSPYIEKELKGELEKAAKQYGGGPGVDMTKFPTFKFTDPVIDPINMEKK